MRWASEESNRRMLRVRDAMDRPFAEQRLFARPVIMQTKGSLGARPRRSRRPSLSQANFGFAIAHVEKGEHGYRHVLFDLIRRWAPSDFPHNIVNYAQIKEQILATPGTSASGP